MPIAIFSNNNNTYSLFLTIQPSEERHEIPHLASAGVRFVLEEGAEDRSFSELSGDRIEYWCNAESYEVEIVHPSPFDRLLWDMCVANGFCGGVTDGQPMHVTDLIPADGVISAEEFAELVLRAECDGPNPEPQHRRVIHQAFRRASHVGRGTENKPPAAIRSPWRRGLTLSPRASAHGDGSLHR